MQAVPAVVRLARGRPTAAALPTRVAGGDRRRRRLARRSCSSGRGCPARSRRRSSRSSPRRPPSPRWDCPVETIGSRFGEIRGVDPVAAPAGRVARPGPRALLAGADRRAARRHRVAALGGRRRRHDRQPPQVQRRARGPGSREHRVRALRRHPGDGRDRAHGDERQERRPDAGRRDDPRRHGLPRPRLPGQLGALRPAGDARRDPRRRRVPHERVARRSRTCSGRPRATSPSC